MATLQWRDVSAPNYTNAIQGLSLFGQQFGNGMSGLSDALAGFQKDRSQAAEQQVMRAAQAYSDPAEYQRALASGQLYRDAGINPEFLTREALNGLNSQATTMIDRATKQQSLTADQFKHGQLVKTTEALEASRPAIAKLISEATGMNFSDEQLNQLPAAQLMKLAENTGALKSTRLSNDETSANLDSGKQARADAEELARFNNAFPDVAFDRNSATAFFKNYKFSNERVRQAAAASLDKYYGSGVVNLDAAAPAGGTSTAATGSPVSGGGGVNAALTGALGNSAGTSSGRGYDTVFGYGKYGSPDKPLSTMTGTEAIKFGQDVLIPTTKAAGYGRDSRGLIGTSAMGGYQFTVETLKHYMPIVLKDQGGLDAVLSPPNQEKLAEAIYNDRKGGDLTKTWAGLKNNTIGAYKNVPWSVARLEIMKGEGTMDPAQALTAAATPANPQPNTPAVNALTLGALRDRLTAAQIQYANPATERIQAIMADPKRRTADFNTVASGLVEDFKGTDDTISKSDMTTYLRRVMQLGRIGSPAVAAEFIKDAAEGTMFGGRSWYGETSVDDRTLASAIDTWKKGGFEQGSDYLRQLDAVGKGLTTAQAAYDQAVSRYRRLELAIQNGRPDMVSGLPALEQEVRKAESQLAAAQIAAESIQAPTRQRVEQRAPTAGEAPPSASATDAISAAIAKAGAAGQLPTWDIFRVR